MNNHTEIQKLLHKFILNECTVEEIEEVISYFRKATSSEELPSVDDILPLLEETWSMTDSTANKIYSKVLASGLEQDENKSIFVGTKRTAWKYISAAAVFLGLLTVGYFYQQDLVDDNSYTTLAPKKQSITLQLDNGNITTLSEDGTSKVLDPSGKIIGSQNGGQLVYNNESSSEKIIYNTLSVPYGKRFQLQLSDGTKAYLNAGTVLKYPVNFLKGKNRQVFLTGEAFFDVAKDADHPFIVNADKLNIRVLGTRFNVSTYPEDKTTDVVLEEGSVRLFAKTENFNPEKSTLLEPGHKGSFSKEDNSITTKAVNTDIYTSWINGELVFRNMTFENILKKMERHYDVNIVNTNATLANEEFNARFGDEPIQKILEYFKITYAIDFTVDDNKITIN